MINKFVLKTDIGCFQKMESLPANLSNNSVLRCPRCEIRDCFIVGGLDDWQLQIYGLEVIAYDKSSLICCSGIHSGVIVSFI